MRCATARIMRKMQVPAYAPELAGIQAIEYNGVMVDWKNTIAILSELIMEDIWSCDSLVVGIAMPAVVVESMSMPIMMAFV
jgi:hypothetical protein